jgi:hypothetical protein
VLKPGETRRVHLSVTMPEGETVLREPFDGRVCGSAGDGLGTLEGLLSDGRLDASGFTARFSARTADGSHLIGHFAGTLDVHTWKLQGTVTGSVQRRDGSGPAGSGEVAVTGCLRPDRWIHIAQYAAGQPTGGLSVQVQVPLPAGSCFPALPPTDTTVPAKPTVCGDLSGAEALLTSLSLADRTVCSVDLRSVLVEFRYRRDAGCC